MYSHILAWSVARGSDGERSSITKSGHEGRNLRFCSAVMFASRSASALFAKLDRAVLRAATECAACT